jgi:hypothetical protein
MKSNERKRMDKRAVLVTTEHRGVFFGYYDGPDDVPTVTIEGARNCIYWGQSVKGFLGLAAGGPDKSCRVGPSVPRLTLQKVTAVVECSADAVKAWEGQPWST